LNEPTTVDEYLEKLPVNEKKELQRIRSIIFETIPEIKEKIAYKICVFSLNRDLVGFASQKNHLSFYTMSPQLVKKMKNDLKGLKLSGATIHFTPQEPLPKIIIQKFLKVRIIEITHSLG
jgi:uncharacterized protein YdhG (YjbR/CyaY superfamily)